MYNDFKPKELVTLLNQSFKLSLNAFRTKGQTFFTKGLSNI